VPDTQEAGASATSTLKQDTGGAWADAAAARAAKNAEKEAKAKVKSFVSTVLPKLLSMRATCSSRRGGRSLLFEYHTFMAHRMI